ncbi:hypothetical protein CYMTET_36345 [Cymbomonas tetramitiformis]|uniref:Ran-binding protein 10 n=1 Tax=Cymbomonas tetramitiformis TaxID=36881 RepID=A0AAE0F7L1_9CHLO|nr:hypothetical protein CYMTET_36345 [Cymbomonas tetramitiformis]
MSETWPWEVTEDKQEEPEPVPYELNTTKCGNFLFVGKDKLSVTYNNSVTTSGAHNNDVGAIQANNPVPNSRWIYYFEVEIKDKGADGKIAIGFSDADFKLSRQPGWEKNSYGYHGDDGKRYHASGQGLAYAETYTTGDVVGAGIRLGSQEMFFTKNGRLFPTAFRDVRLPLYPTIAVHSKNECVEVNFGAKPFVFDLEAVVAKERQAQQDAVESFQLPPGLVHRVVQQYLQHYGYSGTLAALEASSSPAPGSEQGNPRDFLQKRSEIRELILAGNIDGAMEELASAFPEVLQDTSLMFHLHCQKLIELVKLHSFQEAIEYARTHLGPYQGQDTLHDTTLQEVMAVLAYAEPAETPAVSHMMGLGQREAVADAINAALLKLVAPDASTQAPMMVLLKHLGLTQQELREATGSQGEVYDLQRALTI